MKLIIQIPCLNEEEHIAEALSQLPREVPGFDSVEWLIIDDGSTDGTVQAARAAGVDHVVSHGHNRGLAAAFMTGLEACLRLGADVIVNTDADNQYDASCIPDLVAPIVEGRLQIVVGARPIATIEHFSPIKRALQKLGSRVVRLVSGTDIPDAPSGFRAIHRDAAINLYVFNNYTYTLETIIQAGQLGIPIGSVPVRVTGPTRPSRLFNSMLRYMARSALTIFRIFVVYRPFRFFALVALILALPGIIVFLRFLLFYFSGDGGGHVQSLVIGASLIVVAAVVLVGGLVADLVAANRKLLAEVRGRLLRAELEGLPKEK